MTINHIDQLAQWWDEAEEGVIEKGDTVINRADGETTVYVATVRARRQHPNARILARAPKPAWHDADFVVARHENDDHWQGYLRHGDLWIDSEGQKYTAGVLCDVTPLIEAKVTDGMVKRALTEYSTDTWRFNDMARMRHALTAALGLESA